MALENDHESNMDKTLVATENTPQNPTCTKITSEDIIAELLNEVRNSDKPFSVEDITGLPRNEKKKKKHKDHKHKKSKKKRKHASRSRSRSYDSSRSRSRKSKKHKRRRSTSSEASDLKAFSPKRPRSRSHSVQLEDENPFKDDQNQILSPSRCGVDLLQPPHPASDDDDLPVGADFRTVMKEAKMTINIKSANENPLNLSLLPSNPGCSVRKQLIDSFPLSKDNAKLDDDDNTFTSVKKGSQVLQKVIDVKGRGDFVPRNLKIKIAAINNNASTMNSSDVAVASSSSTVPATSTLAAPAPVKTDPDSVADFFGPSVAPPNDSDAVTAGCSSTVDNVGEQLSDSELEKKIELELKDEPKSADGNGDKWTALIENSIAAIEKKNKKIDNSKHSRRRTSRSNTNSPETDEEMRKIVRRKQSPSRRDRKSTRRRSRSHSRERRITERDRGSRRSRSRSPANRRRRSRSRSKGRERRDDRDRDRNRRRRSSRSRSTERARYRRRDSHSRSRSRERGRDVNYKSSYQKNGDGIDKAKLLEIAQRRAQRAKDMGLMDPQSSNPRSIDDFVSYCEKIQRKQERADRREKGERLSSDGEQSDAADETASFKHPFSVRPAPVDSIKINIVNSVPLPTKSVQECIIDSSQLRLVFPVSSGAVHKDNTEWQRVEKVAAPATCSNEQKKFVALTSLEAERARQAGHFEHLRAPQVPMLPPPPLPPSSAMLPPPPVPPKLTAFDLLLPPPPPLPPTFLVPRREDMIMTEPARVDREAPRDVARVLAQRAKAQRVLAMNPNDFEAIRDLKDADDQMEAWAASRNIPGKFTGSTGVSVLRAEDLQPSDPRYNSWIKKDMFKRARPAIGGVGMMLMEKMGWRPGEGLGKEGSGELEPLQLDVKSDRKGLLTDEDFPARNSMSLKNVVATDLSGKHPVSLVMELCTKRRWAPPIFNCLESGPPGAREFLWKVVVNGIEYRPAMSSRNKKDGKMVACQVVLQSLGLVPRDASLPVII